MEDSMSKEKEFKNLKTKTSRTFNKEQIEQRMEQIKHSYDQNCFSKRLLEIMKINKIKKVDLARAIGVSEQTARNWFDCKNGYKPQWIDYMFNMFIFLVANDKSFNPLYLFDKNFNSFKYQQKHETMKKRINRNKEIQEKNLLNFYEKFFYNDKILLLISKYKEIKSRRYMLTADLESTERDLLNEISKCL